MNDITRVYHENGEASQDSYIDIDTNEHGTPYVLEANIDGITLNDLFVMVGTITQLYQEDKKPNVVRLCSAD